MKNSFLLVLLLVSITGSSQELLVTHLTCENKSDPLGIEGRSPALGWQLASNQRGVLQVAYRVLVADDSVLLRKNTGNVWDSKKIRSDQSIQVKYRGSELSSAKNYYWKVMVWDNKGKVSPWSEIARWQMGLLFKQAWSGAQWIGFETIPDSLVDVLPTDGKKDKYKGKNILPLLRKSFTVSKEISRATVFISGLGQFELSINGRKTGDHFLDPGWTKYNKQALYVSFDVTNDLNRGPNAIGVMLGNGFYYIPPVAGRYKKLKTAFGYPKMICRLRIQYRDGSVENIVSNRSWKTTASPITFSSIYGGEDYDANLEQGKWNEPAFDDKSWNQAVIVAGPPALNSQLAEPVKLTDTFSVKEIKKINGRTYVYDFGQNASGIPQLKVQGSKGDTIRIFPSELLKEDGTANQRATGSPYYFQYILKGDGIETWQPRFSYYGFRYMQIELASKTVGDLPVVVDVKSLHNQNAAEKAGTFNCSNELFNKTYSLIDWAIKSNMVSVFTDCPHREKLGWLEQEHLMGSSVCYNYDVMNLYRKQVQDMMYSQTREGLVPEIAPEYVKFDWGGGIFRDSPEWGSSLIIVPWYMYRWYGDRGILESSYEAMKKYINYLRSKAKRYILTQGLGDWYDLGPKPPGVSQLTPMGVTATAIFYYDLDILSRIATLLGRKGDAKQFGELAIKVREAFNNKFFDRATKQYATGSQTANAMAVYMNLVEPKDKKAVVENIVNDIRSRDNSLTAGDIGYHYLLCVLHDAGRDEVIYDMNSRSDVPGYGYQLANGATALTESWAALPTSSNNHFMLGHLMEWFYRGVGGIDQLENSVAYKEIKIKPQVVGNLSQASTSYRSAYGVISTDWRKTNDSFELRVEIPANTTAIVYLPATASSKTTEGKHAFVNTSEVQFLGNEEERMKIKIGSGSYSFVVNY